jgi:UDP-N-acetylmuramoyl-L-alanyl-D-glutamate--2,6-diaminopimelate ligase
MARWFVDRQARQGIPSVSLRRILPEARFEGISDWEVSGCSNDHRHLEPGQVFVASRNDGYDGHAYIRQALDRGAAGVVLERPSEEAGRLQVIVPDASAAHARICHALAGDPSRKLTAIGVGGTFGRTISSLFLRSILEVAGRRCGYIGAHSWSDGRVARPLGEGLDHRRHLAATGRNDSLTRSATERDIRPTGPAALSEILAAMVEDGCDSAVVEFSTEGLEARQAEGLVLASAIVTDVSAPFGFPIEVIREQRRALARLIHRITPGGTAIVNADDPNADLLGALNLQAHSLTFGVYHPAGVSARVDRLDARGARLKIFGFDHEFSVSIRLAGRRAVHQALAAASAAKSLGIEPEAIAAGLEAVCDVSGHLEAIDEGQDFDVRIDEASTAADLFESLAAARAICSGQIHCIVGSQGGQVRSERLALAQAAERAADRVILTADNPRTEDPDRIFDELLAGFRRPGKVRVISDRAEAIEATIVDARPGDVVLIAGKGRNTYQILAQRVVPFDDAAIARQSLRRMLVRQSRLDQRYSA